MRFILNLTLREIRSSWRRLLFFFLCIALGVGSVVALRSLIGNLTQAVASDARALMTADLEISSGGEFSPTDVERITSVIKASDIVTGEDRVTTTSAMTRPAAPANPNSAFIELKGIEPQFPLVGDFFLTSGERFDHSLLENNGIVVAQILLEDLDVKIGDTLRIGDADLVIRGAFDEEPGGSSGFRIGARVFVARHVFESAGIAQNASRVRRRILYRTAEDPTPLVAELREALKETTLTVASYRESQERLSEQFARTENYLALTGLLILVLGGVGVWNVARAFVEQKRRSVAVLKCLGASGNRIMSVYMLQILVLGLAGSLFGVVLAQLGLWAAAARFADALPGGMSFVVGLWAAVQGVVLGVLISALFSGLPLLGVRSIKPKLLLRDENNANLRRLDPFRLVLGSVSIITLLGLAVWQAGSPVVGAVFLVGLAAVSLVLYLGATVLITILKHLRSFGPFAVKQAINSLHRPGNQTRIILIAVGLGSFVVLGVQGLQGNLVREFDLSRNESLPSLFFIDIQPSQIADLTALLETRTAEKPETTPTVRARIAYVNGEPVNFRSSEIRRQQGAIGREFAVTYRAALDSNESVAAGDWWVTTRPAVVPEVSIQDEMADRLKVTIGDSITFDISGRKLTARVANIRKLDLRNTRTAFVFVFRPGALEKAPQTFAATLLKRIGATQRQRLQREIVAEFPNVQIFDVADIIAAIGKLVENFVLAISFVGGFVILTGILILIGSVALTKSQRVYENAIMKTLGTDRKTLTLMLVAEYGLLGFLAGIIGSIFAVLISWTMCRFVLEIEWQFDSVLFAVGSLVTAALVTIVGSIANVDVIFKKPLSILRGQ